MKEIKSSITNKTVTQINLLINDHLTQEEIGIIKEELTKAELPRISDLHIKNYNGSLIAIASYFTIEDSDTFNFDELNNL